MLWKEFQNACKFGSRHKFCMSVGGCTGVGLQGGWGWMDEGDGHACIHAIRHNLWIRLYGSPTHRIEHTFCSHVPTTRIYIINQQYPPLGELIISDSFLAFLLVDANASYPSCLLVETVASEMFFVHSPPAAYIQLCLLSGAHVSLWTWIFIALILTSTSSISVHWNMPNVSSQCCNGVYIDSCRITHRNISTCAHTYMVVYMCIVHV